MKIIDEATVEEMIEIQKLIIGEIGKGWQENDLYSEKAIQQIYNVLMIFKNIKAYGITLFKDNYEGNIRAFQDWESPSSNNVLKSPAKSSKG